MVMLYSSSMTQVGAHYLKMQLVWCALGLVLCVTAASLDYRLLKKFAWPLFGLAVLMLALVLEPHLGRRLNGARRWFDFHGVRFQPSEFAKLALIIALAWYGEHFQRQMHTWKRGIIIPGLIIGLVLGLVFVEPDRGTTILLAAVSGVMLLVAGVRWKYFVPPVLAAVAGLGRFHLAQSDAHETHLRLALSRGDTRTASATRPIRPWSRSAPAAGSGWVSATDGRSSVSCPSITPISFSPSSARNSGWWPRCWSSLAFVVIVICGIYIALNARDTFGLLLGSGITFLIGLQAFINIGVVTSALPNKGLPLPFISYGGSNLLAMLAGVGLLFSIARQARAPLKVARRRSVSRRQSLRPRPHECIPPPAPFDCHRLRRHGRASVSRAGGRASNSRGVAARSHCSSRPRKWTSRP